MRNSLTTIEAFLQHRRLALVGVSQKQEDFSRAVMRELVSLGYDIVPINRHGGTIEGRTAYARLVDLPEPVDGAIVMVPSAAAEGVVRDAAAAGVPRVWFHRGAGPGSSSREAVRAAEELGLGVIDGECPLMFVGHSKVHRFHAAVRRIRGRYPRAAPAPRVPWQALAVLALLQAFVGLGAVVCGALLIADPSGAELGLDPAQLAPGPFSSYLVPGLYLLLVNGLAQLGGLALTVRRRLGAPLAAMALGVLLAGWIVGQWLWVRDFSVLQVVYFGLALIEFGFGAWAHHVRWPRPSFAIRTTPRSA